MPNECCLTCCGTIANRCLLTDGTIFLFVVVILEYGWENCTLMCYLKGVHTTENKISVSAKKRMVAVITLDLFCL
jgi:hypothetical protein